MKPKYVNAGRGRTSGFSLLELMLTLAILTIVLGVVVQGISTVEQRNTVEVTKVDLTQESRQFMDQIVNDIHQCGFPSLALFDPAMGLTLASNGVAQGLKSASSTGIQFEGDVDGTGVSEVYIQLNQPVGGCPCSLQRGTVLKSAGGTPTYYTEVSNVMNTSIFSFYANTGAVVASPNSNLSSIKTIGLSLSLKSTLPDPKTGIYPTIAFSSLKINN
jgi:prepilin-type N-terminal cleavage/methylation domain-containing protein